MDSFGITVRIIIKEGIRVDFKEDVHLIKRINAENLLADRGNNTSEIMNHAIAAGMNIVIPPKKNRKAQRDYDHELYKIRHLVENAFLWLKRWRGIETRYAKNAASFLAAGENSLYCYLA